MNYKTVQEIFDKYSTSAPVKLIAIANDLGINVKTDDLGSQVSGVIKKDKNSGGASGYTIIVNNADNKRRQRFTIAHEIAHFLLHRQYIGDGIQEDPLYRSGLPTTMERQANKLAAIILMPKDLVDKLMIKYNNNKAEVANALEVSRQALEIWLSP